MSERVRIVRFRHEYLGQVVAIEKQSFGRGAWPAEVFLLYASECGRLFFVAKIGREIAGYCVTCLRSTGADLDSISVARKFRRKGVARALLRHTLLRLRRLKESKLTLMVRRDNAPAIRLYRSLGFRRMRTIARYYEDGEAAWRMARTP